MWRVRERDGTTSFPWLFGGISIGGHRLAARNGGLRLRDLSSESADLPRGHTQQARVASIVHS